MDATDVRHLRRAVELARLAREHGNHPFGSLLVSASGEVLAEHENVVVTAHDDTGHPELTLVRWAGRHLTPPERAGASVYTSCEHCPMCATATYWAGIGRIVFALSGARLWELLPRAHRTWHSIRASCSRAGTAWCAWRVRARSWKRTRSPSTKTSGARRLPDSVGPRDRAHVTRGEDRC